MTKFEIFNEKYSELKKVPSSQFLVQKKSEKGTQ
ncbi:MAG: hypothetical protein UU98_C0017G0008 [Parcubacteria group bacterium GW2011_GWD2_42_14]|nr:MAG: hypothetical protein UU98_C0017G0008 [Parcubacteria group bacterium GW2011_GWD2_42_14]